MENNNPEFVFNLGNFILFNIQVTQSEPFEDLFNGRKHRFNELKELLSGYDILITYYDDLDWEKYKKDVETLNNKFKTIIK